jgi:prenyltransferase beta subunit
MLYIQNKQNIELYITSTKGKDFYPLMGLPNVYASDENEDEITFLKTLEKHSKQNTKEETHFYIHQHLKKQRIVQKRKEIISSYVSSFLSYFCIIDEYARFNKKPIHKLVAELVQTAGYVNVHVIIATQRPDARQTLPANIKMGLMTRICFRTADKTTVHRHLDEKELNPYLM